MSEVCCKRCGATDHVKNGIVRGFQRYLCLSCGCNFTMTPPRGKPPAMKALALLLYAMGNVSFGSIARILVVSDVAVLNWVRDEARKLPEPSTRAEVVVVTLDEMWRFVKKRLRNCGFGESYDPIARRRDYAALLSLTGVAPVTKRSAKVASSCVGKLART